MELLGRAPPMPSDVSGSFRAAGLGPVAGLPVSVQASGMPLLKGKHSDDRLLGIVPPTGDPYKQIAYPYKHIG
jgi:hypothetical protein